MQCAIKFAETRNSLFIPSNRQVIRSVLEYGSVVWHHHLTHAQSDKLEALQKRAVRIILYPFTLPYITALGYLKLKSLKHRRTEADKKFFNSIFQPDSSLHHLLHVILNS